MDYIYRLFLVIVATGLLLPSPSFTQEGAPSPILINEIGVMPVSKTRYIELLVVGTPGQPEGPVGLQGWLLDNNSLAFSPDSVYLEFGDCFSTLLPGTLLLIYDDANVHPGISTLNDGLPNDEGVYQIPLSSPCLIKKTGTYLSGGEGVLVNDKIYYVIQNFAFFGMNDPKR